MLFQDIVKGQTLITPNGDTAEVVAAGVNAFALRYEGLDEVYAHCSLDAERFIPVPQAAVPAAAVRLTDVEELRSHPAVWSIGKGVTPEDLASFVECVADIARRRVLHEGADQYSGDDGQKYEGMGTEELVQGVVEELADVINYVAMITAKILHNT